MTHVDRQHDIVDQIMRYEDGEMDWDEVVAFFQRLVDDGLIYGFQGSYQREAQRLIDGGWVTV